MHTLQNFKIEKALFISPILDMEQLINLTSRQAVDKFIDRHCANLTVMNDGEHWFHTDEQISVAHFQY